MTYTKKLTDYAVDLKYEDLPEEVIHQAKLLTLHTLGVTLAACQSEQGKRAIALAKELSGDKKEATIIGDGTRIGCAQAGLVNGTLSDCLDWEDCSWTGHPSSGAIPAALAVGERLKSSGKDLILSIVTGYELYERIAMSVQPVKGTGYLTKGWGLTSWVIYASAITAGKLLNLDKLQMENLIGIAGALTPIVNAKVHITRTDFYHYQWGMNNLNGIAAAFMAESGISPMPDYLDGETGYWVTITDKCGWEWLDKGLGKDFFIMETLYKHWPTNMWIQQQLDGIDTIMKKYKVGPEDVKQIVVSPEMENRMAFEPDGYKSLVDAEFSIPYCIAALMYNPKPGPDWYTEENRKDPKIVELSGKVKADGPIQTLQGAFELFQSGDYPLVTVELTALDESVYKEEVPLPKGHPGNMMTDEEFKDRFRTAASYVLDSDKIEKAIDKIMNMEELDNACEIADLMHN